LLKGDFLHGKIIKKTTSLNDFQINLQFIVEYQQCYGIVFSNNVFKNLKVTFIQDLLKSAFI